MTEPMPPTPPSAPPASDVVPDATTAAGRSARRSNRIEIGLAILLGTAALMTAMSSYVADHDDGQQLNFLQASGRTQSEANDAYSSGDQQKTLDQTIFVEWAAAANDGKVDLAAYLGDALSPTLAPALAEWQKDSSKQLTPFSGDDPIYVPPQYAEGDRLDARATRQFSKADFYDKRGDQFVLATVVFAASLGLLGIASVVRRLRLKAAFGTLGTVALLGGFAVMVTNL